MGPDDLLGTFEYGRFADPNVTRTCTYSAIGSGRPGPIPECQDTKRRTTLCADFVNQHIGQERWREYSDAVHRNP